MGGGVRSLFEENCLEGSHGGQERVDDVHSNVLGLDMAIWVSVFPVCIKG